MGSPREGLSPLEVVCDAGPLIHLDEIGCLDLLLDFPIVFVPGQVWEEVGRHRTLDPPSAERFRRIPVQISAEARFQILARTFSLAVGEQAALSLMALHPTAFLLTDDSAARLAAKALGYRSYGTLGVLLRSIRRGLHTQQQVIHPAKPALPLDPPHPSEFPRPDSAGP
jgi:predicted nucleic acid-binding protein